MKTSKLITTQEQILIVQYYQKSVAINKELSNFLLGLNPTSIPCTRARILPNSPTKLGFFDFFPLGHHSLLNPRLSPMSVWSLLECSALSVSGLCSQPLNFWHQATMASIRWWGPLIDLSAAASHVGDFVQLLVFVHLSNPIKVSFSLYIPAIEFSIRFEIKLIWGSNFLMIDSLCSTSWPKLGL